MGQYRAPTVADASQPSLGDLGPMLRGDRNVRPLDDLADDAEQVEQVATK